MTDFVSILYVDYNNNFYKENINIPDFFVDLNLDQIVNEILEGKEEYDLSIFFYDKLKDINEINYRLEVMQEVENPHIYDIISTFSSQMRKFREYMEYSNSLFNKSQREKWFLDASSFYCSSIIELYEALNSLKLKSKGFNLFYNWLNNYVNSDSFKLLCSECNKLLGKFSQIHYNIRISRDKDVVVSFEDNEFDYCEALNNTFKDVNENVFDYEISFYKDVEMCPLESLILDIVKKKNMKLFDELSIYNKKHSNFINKNITQFDREIQFYVSYIDYITKLRKKGFNFTYPEISKTKSIKLSGIYDLALAYKTLCTGETVVCNDLYLDQEERILILTGPNQGGKTTFARAFGQIFYLASLGCPVPCKGASVFLYDNLYTHFSALENLSADTGKLKEELIRLKQIISEATTNSIIILNELFATTTTYDAYSMGKHILDYFIGLDCVCLYVTHIYELTQISQKTVSLVAAIDSGGLKASRNSAERTYKIIRKPADGIAYANSIAEKYNMSYDSIKERVSKKEHITIN